LALDGPDIPGRVDLDHRMEVAMTRQKQPIHETESRELSEVELNQVSAGLLPAVMPSPAQQRGIIAIQPQAVLCDGSVKPV
jgi:hypothetical protein